MNTTDILFEKRITIKTSRGQTLSGYWHWECHPIETGGSIFWEPRAR